MCGIVGVVSFKNRLHLSKEDISSVIDKLKHRGNDEYNYYLDDHVFMLSCRFSIIGKDNGSQPFFTEDRRIVAVYNGEIFNYKQIKKELTKEGHIFHTDTDGEVIPGLYSKYGGKYPIYCNGDFAVAVYDWSNNKLILSRDRFGVRPLYYTIFDGRVVFSSEVKAVSHLIPRLRISRSSLFSYTQCGFIKSPSSFFENIYQVKASTTISIDSDLRVQEHKYWEIPLDSPKLKADEKDILFTVTDLLKDSISLRLQSDVPVGIYLSGGIDSSIVAYLVKDVATKDLSAFTIDFDNKSFSEKDFSTRFSRQLKLNHTLYTHTEEQAVKLFPRLIYHLEGIANSGGPMAFYALASAAKNNVDVILSGEGADEIFAGYGFHLIDRKKKVFDKWWMKPFLPIVKRYLKYKNELGYYFPSKEELNHVLRTFGIYSPGLQFFARKGLFLLNKIKIKGINYDKELTKVRDSFSDLAEFSKRISSFDLLTYIDFRTWLEHHLVVVNGDRPSMANTIETRYPYLDHRLIEYVARISDHIKIKRQKTKYVLRNLNLPKLPAYIWMREKIPFLAPACRPFFNDEMKKKYCYIEELTSPESIEKKGYFEKDVLLETNRLLKEYYEGNKFQIKKKSYGNISFYESIFLTVLSVQMLDELFIQGKCYSDFER
ncbi:MAG: asparagine synthase (glutamine-hydrolyzing) [Clostridiales Family XIII bacterium]|jgi:asparagine synthase (glutamine-hydrolysing)|nr:asparagine synthase (glutamine-hydrolyzing) [Clostridiales Family XIII bacterium]